MYSMDLQLVICKYQYKCIIYFSFLRKINTVFPSRIPLSLPLSLSLSLSPFLLLFFVILLYTQKFSLLEFYQALVLAEPHKFVCVYWSFLAIASHRSRTKFHVSYKYHFSYHVMAVCQCPCFLESYTNEHAISIKGQQLK